MVIDMYNNRHLRSYVRGRGTGLQAGGRIPQLGRRASGGIIGLQAGGPTSVAGYGTPSQFNVRTEALHPGVAGAYGDLTQRIQDVGNRPLQQFGPGVAGFTGMEAQSQAALGAYGAGQGPQSTLQARSTLGQAARGIGSMIPQQQALAQQYGALAPQAMDQAQASALSMQLMLVACVALPELLKGVAILPLLVCDRLGPLLRGNNRL